jgi:hypothetical protein
MNIKKTLSGLFEFLVEQRRSGTTTLIKKIAEEHDVYVLALNSHQAKEFGDKGISIERLDQLNGRDKKPILVDNTTLLNLIKITLEEQGRLELVVKKQDNLMLRIKHQIRDFERENGEF